MDVKHLEAMPLFDGLRGHERRQIAQHADEIDVPAGQRLAVEGDLAYEFFVIEDGSAAVDVGGESRPDLGPGDFFGEIGLLETEHRRVATVTARTPMTLMVMTGSDFRLLDREVPAVGRKVREAMRERLASV
jgi:CRP-like cAMP-binding protein